MTYMFLGTHLYNNNHRYCLLICANFFANIVQPSVEDGMYEASGL